MCHMSRVTFKKKIKKLHSGGAYRLRVCYQRGLPRLVLEEIIVCVYMHQHTQEGAALYVGFFLVPAEGFGFGPGLVFPCKQKRGI